MNLSIYPFIHLCIFACMRAYLSMHTSCIHVHIFPYSIPPLPLQIASHDPAWCHPPAARSCCGPKPPSLRSARWPCCGTSQRKHAQPAPGEQKWTCAIREQCCKSPGSDFFSSQLTPTPWQKSKTHSQAFSKPRLSQHEDRLVPVLLCAIPHLPEAVATPAVQIPIVEARQEVKAAHRHLCELHSPS